MTTRKFKTEDGFYFWLQLDGTLTDNPDPAKADMTYASLEELKRAVDVEEIFD